MAPRLRPRAAPAAAAGDGGPEAPPRPAAKRQRRGAPPPQQEPPPPPPPPRAELCFSAAAPRVRVGTSGYSYRSWHAPGSFYAGVRPADEFAHYAARFDSVELNATFYGLPGEAAFDAWRAAAAAARPSFEFAVKAPQLLTHRWRLRAGAGGFADAWARFSARCQRLGPHLGPVLFQLPANFKTTTAAGESNVDRLRALAGVLPAGARFAFEFRHASWLDSAEARAVLRRHDWCMAIMDARSGAPPRPAAGKDRAKGPWHGLREGPNPAPEAYDVSACSWGVYARLHGAAGKYVGAYGAAEMARWAAAARGWAAAGRTAYVYFNNTDDGTPPSAVADACALARAL